MNPKLLKLAHFFGLSNLSDAQVEQYRRSVESSNGTTPTPSEIVTQRKPVPATGIIEEKSETQAQG